MAYNNRLPKGEKWNFEEMDEEEAAKLPFIDPAYVTAGEAQVKVKDLEGQVSEKDQKIAELEAMLAAINSGSGKSVTETAVDVIAKIKAATTADEVRSIVGTDTRKTVTDAAEAKLTTF